MLYINVGYGRWYKIYECFFLQMLTTLQTVSNGQYFENKTHFNGNNNNNNGNKSKYNNDSADEGCGGGDNNVNAADNNSNDKMMRSRLDSESSSDVDASCKNSLMFDMDL